MKAIGIGIANGGILTIFLMVIVAIVSRIGAHYGRCHRITARKAKEARYFGFWFALYSGLAFAEGTGRRQEAIRNSQRIGRLDGNGWIERHADQLLHQAPIYIQDVAATFYGSAHILFILGTGVGLLVFADRTTYRRYKWSILLSGMFFLAFVWAYPTASPAITYGLPGGLSTIEAGQALQYAAMPSLHVGWGIIAASCLWQYRTWRPYLAVYVITTALVVILTGNHFLADVIAGATLAAVTVLILQNVIASSEPSAVAPSAPAPAPVPTQVS